MVAEGARTAGEPACVYISDLRPSRVATIVAEVRALGPVRDVETRTGERRRVREATVRDPTGEIVLVLWGEDVDRLAVGGRVRVENGWVTERRGQAQISLGRAGRLVPLPAA